MSFQQGFENDDSFHDVEFDGETHSGPIFYIDKSSLHDVLTTVGVLFIFIAVHIFTAWRTPPFVSTDEQFYQLNNTNGTMSVDVDVKMTELLNLHRFVHVDGSLIRNLEIGTSKTRNTQVSTIITISKGGNVVANEDTRTQDFNLTFKPGEISSSLFKVIEKQILEFDSILIKMTIQTNYTDLTGIKFYWSFGNPSGPKYSHSSRILMALMVGYMLILYFNKFQMTVEKFSQILVVVVGVSAIVSSNPISFFYLDNRNIQIVDAILISLFIFLFRIFLISQFEIIRSSTPTPSVAFLVISGILFAAQSVVEVASSLDREAYIVSSQTLAPITIPSEHYLIYLDIAYILVNIIWIILAYVKSEPSRRLNFFTLVFVLIALSILFSHVFCVCTGKFINTILPSMAFLSMHVTTAAFSIMMLNNGGGNSYSTIKNENDNILDVEQMTDDEINDPNVEEDEVDDEEEEEEEEEE